MVVLDHVDLDGAHVFVNYYRLVLKTHRECCTQGVGYGIFVAYSFDYNHGCLHIHVKRTIDAVDVHDRNAHRYDNSGVPTVCYAQYDEEAFLSFALVFVKDANI